MAIDLPDVEQKFIADVEDFLTQIQRAINKVEELRQSVDDTILRIEALQKAIDSLEGKTVVIPVAYDLPDLPLLDTIKTARVTVEDSGTVTPGIQLIKGIADAAGAGTAGLGEEADAFRKVAEAATEAADSEEKVTAGVTAALAALQKIVAENIAAGTSFDMMAQAVDYSDGQVRHLIETSMDLAQVQKEMKKTVQEAAQEISAEGGDWEAAIAKVVDASLELTAAQREMKTATGSASEAIHAETYNAREAAGVIKTLTGDLAASSVQSSQQFDMVGQATAFVDTEMMKLTQTAATLRAALDEDSNGAAIFTARMVAAGASARGLAAAARADGGGGGLGGIGGLLGGLGGAGPLGITGGWLGGRIAGIATWHVALDSLVEAFIAVGSAIAVAAIGMASLQASFADFHDHAQAVWDVNSALGNQIPGLVQNFKNLQSAMAPQAIEIYGGALSLITGKTGIFAQIAHEVVDLFSTWAARIAIWARSSGTFNKFLQDGVGFLSQWGQFFGSIGQGLGRMMADMPGIAHFLMDIVVGVGAVFNAFTKLPGPIVTATLAIHGLYIWGRLLAAALVWVAAQVWKMIQAFAALATNPFAWVAAAAIALGYMGVEARKAQPAIESLISSMETKLNTMPASQALVQMALDINILQNKIRTVNLGDITRQFSQFNVTDVWQKAGYLLDAVWGHMVNSASQAAQSLRSLWGGDFAGFFTHQMSAIGDSAKGMWDLVSGQGGSAVAFARNIQAMNQEIIKMEGSSRNLYHELGTLTDSGHTVGQSLALMNLAGVRWNDSASVMYQKVVNLIGGFKALGVQGGLLSNSVNAITFATDQQDSKVGQLTQSWTAFFTTVAGGAAGFTAFAQALGGNLTTELRKTSGAATTVTTTAQGLAQAFATAHGNMTGLGQASISAQSQFIQTATAAQTEMNNLMMLSSAAGMGAKGTAMLSQAAKDMIQTMLPAAKDSQTLTTVLYALAQNGGYKGADSFKALSDWVGKTQDPMKNLQKIVETLTVNAGNLTTDVKNLSTALGTSLNQAMATAIINGGGTAQAMATAAKDVNTLGVNSGITQGALAKVAGQFIILTGNTSRAHQMFDTFMIGLGLTKGAADRLWNSLKNVAQGIANIHNKNVVLTEHGTGIFTITGPAILKSQGKGGSGNAAGGLAAGGLIHGPGTGTSDSIPAHLSAGEFVVNAASTAKHMELLHAINSRHFATGGYVGPIQGLVGATQQFDANFQQTMTSAMESEMSAAMRTAMAAARAAAAKAALASFPGVKGSGGVFNTMLQIAKAMGWGGQSGSWWNVIMRESGGNMFARNPSSGAYGIAQFINGPGEYAQWGGNVNTVVGQLTAMANYIRSRYGSPAGAWAHELCVPLTTMILTRTGWKRYDQITDGDETLGYNPETGRSEWTRITAIHHYSDAEVWRMGNSRWQVESTPNHRWLCDVEGLNTFISTKDLRQHRIRLIAPADTSGIPCLSTTDVQVLAWIQGDGTVSRYMSAPIVCPECGYEPAPHIKQRGNGVAVHRKLVHGLLKEERSLEFRGIYDGCIYQSKPDMIIKIRALLADIPHRERIRTDPRFPDRLPNHVFVLRRDYLTDLLKRADVMENGPESFVLALSPDQRVAWLSAMIDAEGSSGGRIYQNDGPLQEAIKLGVYLEGFRPSYTSHNGSSTSVSGSTYIGMRQPYIYSNKFEFNEIERQPVWCVTTELGSWTARQGQHIFLTSNSAGWYDKGGLLPPGLSLALNTTGSPEPVGAGAGVVNVHSHVYLDSKEVFTSVQQQSLKYQVRNSGLSRGISSGGALSPLQGQTVVKRGGV